MLAWVASKVARSAALVCDQLAAVPALMAAPIPTLTTSMTSSVQYVDLTERILVNSERSAPPNPARPEGGGSTGGLGCGVVTAISAPLVGAGHGGGTRGGGLGGQVLRIGLAPLMGAVLHAAGGPPRGGRLQRGADPGQLVQPDALGEGDVADLRRGQPAHAQRATSIAGHGALGRDQRPG